MTLITVNNYTVEKSVVFLTLLCLRDHPPVMWMVNYMCDTLIFPFIQHEKSTFETGNIAPFTFLCFTE